MADELDYFKENNFNFFKPKRTGTNFDFAKVNGATVESGYYKRPLNQKFLLETLLGVRERGDEYLDDFYYKDYESKKYVHEVDYYTIKVGYEYKDKKLERDVNVSIPLTVTEEDEEITLSFSTEINKRTGRRVRTYPSAIGISIDLSKTYTTYSTDFTFEKGTPKLSGDKTIEIDTINYETGEVINEKERLLAIRFSTKEYNNFRLLIKYFNPSGDLLPTLKYRFLKAHEKIGNDGEKLENYYRQIPQEIISEIHSDEDLFNDLVKLMAYDEASWIDDSSTTMLKVLSSFKDFKYIYDALDADPKTAKEIYGLINSDSGDNSKETYCNLLTFLCLVYQPIDSPDDLITIRLGGKYLINSDLTGGSETEVRLQNYITYRETVENITPNYGNEFAQEREITSRKYYVNDYFHPLQLMKLEDMETGQVVIVPALYIKRLSDIQEWSEIIDAILTIITIISIFTSVGILIRGATGLIRIFAITDIIVGSTDLALSNKNIQKALRDSGPVGTWFVENWPIISFMSSMGILSVQMARGIIRNGPKLIERLKSLKNFSASKQIQKLYEDALKILNRLDEVADGLSNIRRGKYLGQILQVADIAKIKKYLGRYGVDLQIGKSSGSFEVEGYFTKSGQVVKMERKNAAMFITDGKNWKMVLRENATVYEFLHEFMHFRHCKKLGKRNYLNLGSRPGEKLILRERFVFDKMVKYNKYLNKSELKHAEGYMNAEYKRMAKKYGFDIPPGSGIVGDVELPFNVNSITTKRQPVNIDRLLKLK